MCARFNLRTNPYTIAEIFGLLREPPWSSRYNIAPTQQVLVIRLNSDGERSGDLLRWGLIPSWAEDAAIGSKMINARAESLATKPAFRDAFRKRRCVIPVSGFYEWQPITSRITQPWHIHHRNDELLAFAGIWETWKDDDGAAVETCSIVTTVPNPFMAEVHDRMPVILPAAARHMWLDPKLQDPQALQGLLVPYAEDSLIREPIGALINSPRNDSEACIKPVKLSRGLFD